MEFEDRNKKPEEPAKNLPMAVLISLVGIVCLLLYVGWQMISDDPSNVSDLTPTTETILEPQEITPESSDEETESVNHKVIAPEETKVAQPVTDGSKSAKHSVSKGETLFSIATRYNLTVSTLSTANPGVSANSLKEGASLSVPVLAIHTVGPGDILRVVGGKYGVTVKAIMTANGKDKNHAKRGEKLIIPFKEKR